jgi:replicative DNA helicase
MAAYYCSIETYNVNTVLSSEKHQAAVKEFLEKLKDAPLYVIYEWNISEENFITAIEEFVQEHDIKIVFIDESNGNFEYSSTKRIKVNSLKLLALKMNIPVVATTCIWNDREGMEGMKPFLQDLYFCSEVHGHDTVIGHIKYDRHYVYENDNGHDLHNTIHLEILKKRGLFKKRKFLIPTGYFYFKDYAEKEKKALEEIRKASDYQIDTLIKKFDLTLEHDEILPF